MFSCRFPVAQIVEHGTSNAKIMGSIPTIKGEKAWAQSPPSLSSFSRILDNAKFVQEWFEKSD